MPVVLIPTAYRAPTKGADKVKVSATNVLDCLREVEGSHPGFLELVLDPKGAVHPFVKLFKNGEQIDAEALDTSVASEDEVEVLAAIAGG